jgi:uncharacterized protein DUF5666
MVRSFVFALALCCIATLSWAHGTGQHVLGTVTAIDAQHIEVKTQKGTTVSVNLTKETRFKQKGNPKSTQRPAVGDRVVIEATKEDNDKKGLTATEVHYSAAKNVPAPAQ